MTLEELPIYSEEMEKAVLGCMLSAPDECCDIVIDSIKGADFFVKAHRSVFGVMASMWTSGSPIDLLTVSQAIKNAGLEKAVGGSGFLIEAGNSAGHYQSLPSYLRTVKEKSVARRMQSAAIILLQKAQDATADHLDEIDQISKELDSLSSGFEAAVWSGDKPWDEFVETYKTKSDENLGGIPTGFGHLDSLVRFKGGRVIVLAARAGIGKTTAALNLVVRWWEQGIAGAQISLEMTLRDLQECIVANVEGITRDALEARQLSDSQMDALLRAVARGKRWKWAVYDRPRLTMMEFRALCREQARKGAKFIVLDYFQLVETEGSRQHDRRMELERWMREIKRLSMELNLVIIVLSQLNRDAEERPKLAHLKETGSIEQDADVVILLYEPDEKSRTMYGHRNVTWIIAKNRRADQRDINFLFDGPHARFIECPSK